MTMTNTETYTYSVGTAATGSFVLFARLEDAQAEAMDWARSEPDVTVYVWALNGSGNIVDAIDDYRYNA